ncbi:MAG TPA: hypothetical protein VGL99_26350, partial [Chloroflexota bacterium]
MTPSSWAWLAAVPLVLASASACRTPDDLTTPRATVRPAPTAVPIDEPTPTPAATPGAGAVQTLGQAGMRSPLPLLGEYAVTANRDDRTLSVIPIGLAKAVATVSLDVPPHGVATAPDSDTAVTISETPSLGLASLNSSTVLGSVDAASMPIQVVSPPAEGSGVVLVLSDGDRVQAVDTSARTLGPLVQLDAGPHAVGFGRAGVPPVPRIYVANADAGSVSVLDAAATRVDRVLAVGGRPVGVAQTIDGRLWIADASAGAVVLVDAADGRRIDAIPLGPGVTGLSGLAATHDGHYLVLSSSAADHGLVSVDLLAVALGRTDAVVRSLAVDGGVLALATGAETTRAYATTGRGSLLYWDLVSNSISETVAVGQGPVSLALGMVVPLGAAPPPASA